MKARLVVLFASVSGFLLLAGCVPDLVSVSRDGTIALTLREEGKFEPLEGEGQQVYLTNANADFLTKVQGMDDCFCPQISPSGKFIVAISKDKLVLYDRESKRRRTIYRPPKGATDAGASFPTWSPDEKKIAFFVGKFEEDAPDSKLYMYNVKRRELELLAHRARPKATWLPDNKRLFYISPPRGVSEGDAPPFGDLKRISVETRKVKSIAVGQLLSFSKIAVFPEGEAVVFPHISGEGMQLGHLGLTLALELTKRPLARHAEAARRPPPEEAEGKPESQQAAPAPAEAPAERSLREPLHPWALAVSPDGKRVAYARFVQVEPAAEGEKTEGKKPEKAEAEAQESETKRGAPGEESLEFCVANADFSESVPVLAGIDKDAIPQVFWVSNTRLMCVTVEKIILVDADGQNKFDLIEAIQTKFADRFKREEKKEK